MSRNPLKLKIAYLYPDILKNFCDRANVETFCTRTKWRDVDIEVYEINANDRIQASKFDFYYIGGINTCNLIDALNIIKENGEELKVAALSGVPMLAVNCGYLLFGDFFQLHNQMQNQGLGILNVNSITGKNYCYDNIYGTCEFLKNMTIAGFENHGMLTYLKEGVSPFIHVQKGFGNNGRDKTEGARFNNVIGTYITSSILAQNPHLCDFLIANALRIKYKCRIPLTKLTDDIEWYSHNYILEMK